MSDDGRWKEVRRRSADCGLRAVAKKNLNETSVIKSMSLKTLTVRKPSEQKKPSFDSFLLSWKKLISFPLPHKVERCFQKARNWEEKEEEESMNIIFLHAAKSR